MVLCFSDFRSFSCIVRAVSPNNSKQLAPSSKVIIAIIFQISVGESFRVAEKLAIAGCMINGDGPGMPDL